VIGWPGVAQQSMRVKCHLVTRRFSDIMALTSDVVVNVTSTPLFTRQPNTVA